MPDRQNNYFDQESTKNEQKKKNIAITFLLVFGVFLIVFSGWSFRNKIYNPFNIEKKNNSSESTDSDSVDEMALMRVDTDGDGLSDYEELYVYNTSPYLADTDSDGYSDYEEVMEMNTNPLCPEGQDCLGLSNAQGTSSDIEFNDNDNEDDSEEVIEDNNSMSIEDAVVDGEVNPDFLRELLINNGLNKKDVDAISDEELKRVYQEVISENYLEK